MTVMGIDPERASRFGLIPSPWDAEMTADETDLSGVRAGNDDLMWRAWADGSCVRSQNGPGGWGVILIGPAGQRRELSGSEPRTTNNKMELSAILAAVRAVPKGASITVTSDSEYAVRVSSRRYKAKKNRDLVQAIWQAAENRYVKYQWVRGHNGHAMNERADQLANQARVHQRS